MAVDELWPRPTVVMAVGRGRRRDVADRGRAPCFPIFRLQKMSLNFSHKLCLVVSLFAPASTQRQQ